ncbi:MAG: SUMF1/EgtB/PvdO family nonheme iron enzyme, partial [Blastocatellia bacterium]
NLFRWRDEFELPERGALIRKLSELAYAMQLRGFETEGAQVRIAYDDACAQLPGEQAEKILAAGIALNVLDKDDSLTEIVFFHQLLQEYFAARRLAKEPRPDLVEVEWSAEKVRPTLPEALSKLADGDPLPPLPQTGWEETTLTAAPMTKDRPGFLRDLMACNLPLAARCAASPEAGADEALKNEIRAALLERTRDPRADLRARIAAGEALGLLGDPRFVRCSGPHGEYLLPPMVEIAAGTYPMGDDKGQYDDEKPACRVTLPAFRIGQFPVTNAEYQCFLDADGYEEPRWWDTAESLDWLSGKGSTEGVKQQWREDRKTVQSWTEEYIRDLVKQNRWTSKEAEAWITWRNWTDEQWEIELEESFPAGKQYRQPDSWDDARFNNPAQPVVGITWFEARAYCNWLTANCGGETIYRLPTEAEFEAAARGAKGRTFPYGDKFDSNRCNTFESHIRRTTPIGVFDNATPEGAYDLSGNAFTWTLSIYDQEKFPYPYRSDDGREDIHQTGIKRVLRGGSWADFHRSARAACRDFYLPAFRFIFFSVFVLLVSVASPFSSDLCLGRCAFRAGAFSASPSCAVGA